MNNNQCIASESVESPVCAWNANRFTIIQDKAQILKGLVQELNDMVYHKFDALLGDSSTKEVDEKTVPQIAQCWADRVILEQDITLDTLKIVLEKIESI